MKSALSLLFALVLATSCSNQIDAPFEKETPAGPVILVHGGAGSMYKGMFSNEVEAMYLQSLQNAVDSGYKWLGRGMAAEQVVVQVIQLFESDTLFNAGTGAVLTAEGKAELDASIMRGSDLNAGAVAGVQHIEHPIALAALVMDSSKHVMLSNRGAERFAWNMNVDSIPNEQLVTYSKTASYRKALESKYGTVGCVVLDAHGNLAAGTSTGGMMLKENGRIGDSPIIGAGTYADNNGCAVSCTGHGEFFIRYAVAHSVSMRVHQGETLESAANAEIHDVLEPVNGQGGLIAVDADGNFTMPFNTNGMFRGMRNSDTSFVAMYK